MPPNRFTGMASRPDLEVEKAAARRQARALRAAIDDPGAALGLIDNFPVELAKMGGPVAGYWPFGGEIDCRPLMAALTKAGLAVALPRMDARDAQARFLMWEGGPLRPDAFGVMAPPADAREIFPKLILTPLLAFDRRGQRLGQGGGHYDKTLARLKPQGAVAVGIAYAAQEMDEVPTGPLDQPMDWIVTDKEAIRCWDGFRPEAKDGLRGR